MQTYLEHWMASPIFVGDAAKTRNAELLHVLSLSALVLTVAVGLAVPFIFANPLVTTSIVWGLALFALLLQVLMRRGHVWEASVLFLEVFWMLVTGVILMDTGIVNHLNKTIQAARLKGARTIVTGISDAVAEAIVDLGIDWGAVETLRDLQTGLRVALEQMDIHLEKGQS